MKKIALAILLLILLVAISYLTSMRSQTKLQTRYDQGYEQGSQTAAQATKRADSIGSATDKAIATYRDSLETVRTARERETDSLKSVLAEKDSAISTLKQKAKSAKAPKNGAKPVSTQANLNHSQVLDYYKRRLNELPKDLSDYERKVALNELRDETAKKFSITVGELDKIRQKDTLKE